MNIEINNKLMFGTPLFSSHLHEPDINIFLEEFVKNLEKTDENSYPYCSTGYTTFKKGKILELPMLNEFSEVLLSIAEEIHNSLSLNGKLYFSDSWLSINRKYSHHNTHHHLPSCWSGVYYVKAKPEDGGIDFLNKEIADSSWPFTGVNEYGLYTSPAYNEIVETGKLLIFPSYLNHVVHDQKTDNERITLAFNIDVRDE